MHQKKLNLTNQIKVSNWVKKNKPDVIIMTAAKDNWDIYNNNYFPGEFIYDNLLIQSNIIEECKSK